MIGAGGRDTYRVNRLRGRRRGRGGRGRASWVRVGAPDPSLTKNAGLVTVTELVERLDLVAELDTAVGPIKERDRGFTAGEVLVGMMAAQLAGEDFLVGLDRQRADAAGQVLTPVPGLASTTAAGVARRGPPPPGGGGGGGGGRGGGGGGAVGGRGGGGGGGGGARAQAR